MLSEIRSIPPFFRSVHNKYPDKFLLPTEACNINNNKVLLGDWDSGVKYSNDIMENLNNWAVGWVDWNLCLDEQGIYLHILVSYCFQIKINECKEICPYIYIISLKLLYAKLKDIFGIKPVLVPVVAQSSEASIVGK